MRVNTLTATVRGESPGPLKPQWGSTGHGGICLTKYLAGPLATTQRRGRDVGGHQSRKERTVLALLQLVRTMSDNHVS